ncbi:GIY-YIG nuclease family protein [Streptomyces sp. NBC_01426]|uniref:GIY-YIG nuclease family protein n=1 Tax=Streptomyces sp. NBC_01426 TaxID=2975866 RepID=UPI003FCED794
MYRLYDAEGRLLYVGITMNLQQRLADHRRQKFWWHLVKQASGRPVVRQPAQGRKRRGRGAPDRRSLVQRNRPHRQLGSCTPVAPSGSILAAGRRGAPLADHERHVSSG